MLPHEPDLKNVITLFQYRSGSNPDLPALMLTSMNKCDTINSIESLNLNGIQEIQSKYRDAERLKTRYIIEDLGTR